MRNSTASILRNITTIIVVVVAVIALSMLLQSGCGGTRPLRIPSNDTITVVSKDTIVKYDTIIHTDTLIVPKYITYTDTVVIRDTLVIDSIIEDYFAKRIYADIINKEDVASTYELTISKNRLEGIDIKTVYPVLTVTNTVTNTTNVCDGTYVGIGVGPNLLMVEADYLKKKIAIGGGLGLYDSKFILKANLKIRIR